MSNSNVKASARAALIGAIDPDAYAASTVTSAWVSFADFLNILAIISVGDMGTGATLDAKVQQAKDATGTDAKDIDGKAITQLDQAGGDDNQQALIDISQDDIDVENEFTHVQLSITIATDACDAGAFLLGFDPVKDVASESDATSVAEIAG